MSRPASNKRSPVRNDWSRFPTAFDVVCALILAGIILYLILQLPA